MDVNRLADLRKAAGLSPERRASVDSIDGKTETKTGAQADMANHMHLYEPIKKGLSIIRRNVVLIEKYQEEERTEVNDAKRKAIMDKLDQIMRETTDNGVNIKTKLDEIKKANEAFEQEHKNSAVAQMRINLYQTHLRRFHQSMNSYNQASHDFKKALKDRTRRQLNIVDANLTTEQVDKIVEEGRANEVIQYALVSEDLDSVIQDIEERHKDIVKIERQVREVNELFKDMAALVELQQESLDVIENRVNMARDYAEQALTEIVKAKKYQDKNRKRKCCILILLLVLALIIIGPVLGTQLA